MVKYLKDGEGFSFPREFGWTGSSDGRHDARNHPSGSADDEYGDGSYVERRRHGGRQGRHDAPHLHPRGHEVVHAERGQDGSVVHHHAHGGFSIHHSDGHVTHHEAHGGVCHMATGGPVPPQPIGAQTSQAPIPGAAQVPANPFQHATITMPLSDAAQGAARLIQSGRSLGARQAMGALAGAAHARGNVMPAPRQAAAPAEVSPGQQSVPALKKGGRAPKATFDPGGKPGKLHHELGIPEGETIPAERLREATHSRNPEVRRDAIRAETMKKWHHGSR